MSKLGLSGFLLSTLKEGIRDGLEGREGTSTQAEGSWACPCHTSQVERDDQFHREVFCQAEITKAMVTLILSSTPQRHRPPILFLTKVSTLSYSIVTHPPTHGLALC